MDEGQTFNEWLRARSSKDNESVGPRSVIEGDAVRLLVSNDTLWKYVMAYNESVEPEKIASEIKGHTGELKVVAANKELLTISVGQRMCVLPRKIFRKA